MPGKDASPKPLDHSALVAELADGIGDVVGQGAAAERGYVRIVAGSRTLVYVNPKKDALDLDFKARDVEGAPAKLRGALEVRGTRAHLRVNGRGGATARALLQFVAGSEGS